MEYLAPALGLESRGYSILAGGIVLAVMSFPIIIHILMEVLAAVPKELRYAAWSLGATRWQTTAKVVLKEIYPGLLSAIILAFSRAFGETLAVLMVVGNVIQIPTSLLDAGYPLPTLIANNYGEMLSIPQYQQALMFAALLLFTVVVFFNLLASLLVRRYEKRLA